MSGPSVTIHVPGLCLSSSPLPQMPFPLMHLTHSCLSGRTQLTCLRGFQEAIPALCPMRRLLYSFIIIISPLRGCEVPVCVRMSQRSFAGRSLWNIQYLCETSQRKHHKTFKGKRYSWLCPRMIWQWESSLQKSPTNFSLKSSHSGSRWEERRRRIH